LGHEILQSDLPIIDLDGYRRLEALERELSRSPVAIALLVAAYAGLLLIAASAAFFFGLLAVAGWDQTAFGIVLALAGALLSAAAIGLSRVCKHRSLARLCCPHCGAALARYVADLEQAEGGRWRQKGAYLDGRRYSAPFLDEGDEREWVRAMKEVWACVSCRAYVDGCEPHERACSADELARLQPHGVRREAR
jgi:hypothetical protein